MKSTKSKQFWRAFLFGMVLVHAWGFAVAIQEVIVVDFSIMESNHLPTMMMAGLIEMLILVALTVFVFALSNPILRRVGVRPFNNINTQNIPLWKAGTVLLGCLGGLLFMMTVMVLFGLLLTPLTPSPLAYDSLAMRLFLYGLSLLTLFAILQIKQQYQYWRR